MADTKLRNDTALPARLAANRILAEYLHEDENGLPILSISPEEARKLGVTRKWYNQAVKEIEKVRTLLPKIKAQEAEIERQKTPPTQPAP